MLRVRRLGGCIEAAPLLLGVWCGECTAVGVLCWGRATVGLVGAMRWATGEVCCAVGACCALCAVCCVLSGLIGDLLCGIDLVGCIGSWHGIPMTKGVLADGTQLRPTT